MNKEFITPRDFIQGIESLNLVLNNGDMDRLLVRFDTDGQNLFSVARFFSMITFSEMWRQAWRNLDYHEEAVREANILREQIASNTTSSLTEGLTLESISMAEYLGIRVISERHLLWIGQLNDRLYC